MARAWIALGANLGEAERTIRTVVARLAALPQCTLQAQSRLYDTSPVLSSGPDYVNAVVRLETSLTPEALHERLRALENEFGRVRPAGVVNAPRTLDLDMLAFEGVRSDAPQLTLPHPRAKDRLFVLVPLSDIEGGDALWEGETLEQRIAALRASDPSQRIDALDP